MTRAAQIMRLLLVLATTISLAACNDKEPKYQGWIEANLIFVAPDEMGRVVTLNVREGDPAKAGEPLFTLDDDLQKADLNLTTASQTNARQTFDRAQQLAKTGAGTQKDFDAAQAELRSAEARVNSAQTRLSRRKLASPVTGTVQQIYFRPGEMVPAGRPILAILPPGNLKVRFFVPQSVLPRVAYGDSITVRCDGCADQTAKVSFIAKSAEYTPPVIYSLEERHKLVFLIEALPSEPDKLRVGQPVDVWLEPNK
jgi:HlyD family secretion protein